MKLFYLENCPHCQRARNWMQELYVENPIYKEILIEMIEESREVELADSYDYYYVPCFFDGDQKLRSDPIGPAPVCNHLHSAPPHCPQR